MFLIPLFILIFAGTSLFLNPDLTTQEEMQLAGDRLIAVVDDPARRTEVEKTVATILNKSDRFNKAFQDARKQVRKQYKDHSAGAEEALAVLSALNLEWESAQQQMVDLQFDLREQLTEEEWGEIYNPAEKSD